MNAKWQDVRFGILGKRSGQRIHERTKKRGCGSCERMTDGVNDRIVSVEIKIPDFLWFWEARSHEPEPFGDAFEILFGQFPFDLFDKHIVRPLLLLYDPLALVA